MIKLKVSYKNEEELKGFLGEIRHKVGRIKFPMEQKGRYKRAYIDIQTKPEESTEDE